MKTLYATRVADLEGVETYAVPVPSRRVLAVGEVLAGRVLWAEFRDGAELRLELARDILDPWTVLPPRHRAEPVAYFEWSAP